MSVVAVFLSFLRVGSTVFGGLWAATRQLEKELVDGRGWLTKDDLQAQLLLAALIPAPKFLAMGGLVGFKVRRWPGLVAAITGLLLPTSSLVVAAVFMLRPELVEGALAPMGTSIGVAVVGLLFGNAYHQLRAAQGARSTRLLGLLLTAALFVVIVSGVPLLLAAAVAFAVGPMLLNRSERRASERFGDG